MVLGLIALVTAIGSTAATYKDAIMVNVQDYFEELKREIEREHNVLKRAVVHETVVL